MLKLIINLGWLLMSIAIVSVGIIDFIRPESVWNVHTPWQIMLILDYCCVAVGIYLIIEILQDLKK